jgi:hypothetical protein
MMGSGLGPGVMDGWYVNPWGGFGFSVLNPAGILKQHGVGSGGYQGGHVDGGSYIGASNLCGLYENTNLRANAIHLETYDCDSALGHANSGYTYTTSVALPTQVVPTIALGGNNIKADQGSFLWPSGAGNVVITGLGFQPQLVILFWSKTDSYNRPYTFGDANGSSCGFGAASSSSAAEQYCHYGMEPADNAGYTSHMTGKIAVVHSNAAIIATATLTSMDADGFTLSFSGADTGEPASVVPRLVGWTAFRDIGTGGFKVGNAVVPGGTGTVSYGGCGFKPDQVIISHGNATAANTFQFGGSWGIGCFDDTLQAARIGGPNMLGFATYGAHYMSLGKAALFATNGIATIDAAASFASMGSDGFSLNWTTVGAGAGRPFGWIALKTTGDNRPCGGDIFIPQLSRRF